MSTTYNIMQWKHVLDVTFLYVGSYRRLHDILDQHRRLAVVQYLLLGHARQQKVGDAAIVKLLHAARRCHLLQFGGVGQTKQRIQTGGQIQILFGFARILYQIVK